MLETVSPETNAAGQPASPYFEIITEEILKRGLQMRLKGRGQSMGLFFQTGDVLLIEPRKVEELSAGDIILYRRPPGIYVVHRLIKKQGGIMLTTKGDGLPYNDAPVTAESVMGRVVQVERNGKLLIITGNLGRFFGILITWFSHGRYPNQRRIIRNLGRLYWLIGGKYKA